MYTNGGGGVKTTQKPVHVVCGFPLSLFILLIRFLYESVLKYFQFNMTKIDLNTPPQLAGRSLLATYLINYLSIN